MSVEGQLLITLQHHAGKVEAVDIHSTRPLKLTEKFSGLPPQHVCQLISALYSLCGVAQYVAASKLLSSLSNEETVQDVRTQTQRSGFAEKVGDRQESWMQALLIAETLREHVFSFYRATAHFVTSNETSEKMQRINQGFSQLKHLILQAQSENDKQRRNELIHFIDEVQALTEKSLLKHDLATWRSFTTYHDLLFEIEVNSAALKESADQTVSENAASFYCGLAETLTMSDYVQSEIDFLSDSMILDIANHLSDPHAQAFVAQPELHTNRYETSSLARQSGDELVTSCLTQWGRGIATRWVARMQELINSILSLRDWLAEKTTLGGAPRLEITGDRTGVIEVEAARGRLIHRAELDEAGRVNRYQILAPTEWNFHRKGVLAEALKQLSVTSKDDLKKRAEAFIAAIDPCVGYTLRIDGAAR